MSNKINDPLYTGYYSYLEDIKRLKHRSITDIKCTLNGAIEGIQKIRPGKELWEATFEDYLEWIETRRKSGRSAHSINKELSHIRGLLNYAWNNGRCNRNVLDGFRPKDADVREAPPVLDILDAEKLIAVCGQKTHQDRLKRLVILLLYGCGFRTNELCSLDVSDVDRERQEIFVRKGKGDIQRRIPVASGVWTELLAYLSERGGRRGPLFKTEIKKTRINALAVLEIVREAAEKAGLKIKVTPKVLRHTFATHLMDAGVGLGVISVLMGHRSPQETGVYLHALKKKKIFAVSRLQGKIIKEDN
jgi:site-specific recombinase XerD